MLIFAIFLCNTMLGSCQYVDLAAKSYFTNAAECRAAIADRGFPVEGIAFAPGLSYRCLSRRVEEWQ
jgi:hypothetical protein